VAMGALLVLLLALLVLPVWAAAPGAASPMGLRAVAAWVTVPRRLSPRAAAEPPAVSYGLEVAGQPQVLRLRPQHGLASRPFSLVTYGGDGALRQEQAVVLDTCFYRGEVLGSRGSVVALSHCGEGLRGVLWVRNQIYEIEPIPGDPAHRHLLYRMEPETSSPADTTCGVSPEELRQQALLPWFQPQWSQEEDKEMVGDWWTHRRYMKMVVVVDKVRFEKWGSNESEVVKQVIGIVNIGNSLLEQLSVQIFLVGLEIWTESNLINITKSPSKTLSNFNKWRREHLSQRISNDHAHLIAFQSFGNTLGQAYVGSICSNQWSSSISSFGSRKMSSFVVTFVHELGHVIGMHHDEPGCKCRCRKCIMHASSVVTDAFSDCSFKYYFNLLAFGASCMRQPAALSSLYSTKHKYCGNKIVEGEEQCDCGSESSCRKDPCCQQNCTLTKGSTCAAGKCCENCMILPAGTLCRASTGVCDLPEYCNGTSPQCPTDVYIQDGAPCKDGAYCYQGKCSSHREQCQRLFGKKARAAALDCFQAVNTQGDRFGNCGIRDNVEFTKCRVENVLCGRIQCENVHKLPHLQNHLTLIQTPVKGKSCWGLDYHVGMPTADVGAVEDGTSCGSDKLCINRTCTSVSLLKYDCDVTKCHGRGVCNNRKNCHCSYGWAPPYCEWEGFGGSVDSGPPPARATSTATLVITPLLFSCIFGVNLIICYKKEIVGWLKRKK
ncbi:ADA21 protein, partial [Rhinopomastus cyanomelas]|nr:ADA21 protein [Rhinopomastus cyanomelas]